MAKRGRVKKIQAEHYAVLREIVSEKPLATLEEVGTEFARRTGLSMQRATLSKGCAMRVLIVGAAQGKISIERSRW